MIDKIKTFIIDSSKEGFRQVEGEFLNRNEFDVTLFNSVRETNGASLLQIVKDILNHHLEDTDDLFIVCDTHHRFTKQYNIDFFFACIAKANSLSADIVTGGVGFFTNILQVTENLVWIDRFHDLQFMVIFKRFFTTLKHLEVDPVNKFEFLTKTECKFLISPFISFSEGTVRGNSNGKEEVEIGTEELFSDRLYAINRLSKIASIYKQLPPIDTHYIDNQLAIPISIPTFVINLPERTDRKTHIEQQFRDKEEFDLRFIEACKHKIGAVGLWNSICKIIRIAKQEDHDVIIICEDDHQFTPVYSRDFLIKNILEASEQGADYIVGGTVVFRHVVPITKNRFWVDTCASTQFIIIYKHFYDKIIDAEFSNDDVADLFISELTTNVMLLCPFISVQRDFGYSDVTLAHSKPEVSISQMFQRSDDTIRRIQRAYARYAT